MLFTIHGGSGKEPEESEKKIMAIFGERGFKVEKKARA